MNITATCTESKKKNYKTVYKCESENNIQNMKTSSHKNKLVQ